MIIKDINNPDMPLQALFNTWPEIAAVFLSHRMQCFGCPIAPFHSIIDACLEYGLDETRFRQDLSAVLCCG